MLTDDRDRLRDGRLNGRCIDDAQMQIRQETDNPAALIRLAVKNDRPRLSDRSARSSHDRESLIELLLGAGFLNGVNAQRTPLACGLTPSGIQTSGDDNGGRFLLLEYLVAGILSAVTS